MRKTMDVDTTLPERPAHRHVATGESHTQRFVPMPPMPPVQQVAPLPPAPPGEKVMVRREPAQT
jgi:hypothetical protein